MKLKALLFAASVSTVSVNAIAVTDAESTAFVVQLQNSTDISALVQQQPAQDIVALISAALANESIDTQLLIQTAMEAFPELAVEIAQAAREAGVDNESITTAAILAGIDPTLIGEATAAGIAAPSPLAEPASPGAPSSSGGGQSVSPST